MCKSIYFRKFLLAIFFTMTGYLFSQIGIKVTYYTSAEASYNIDTTGKLYFSGDNLLIKETSSSNDVTIPISIIQKITLTTYVLGTDEIGSNTNSLKIYPNPSDKWIKISGLKNKSLVKIYSMTGKLVHSGDYTSETEINISNLSSGLYLVQVNGSTLKLLKK